MTQILLIIATFCSGMRFPQQCTREVLTCLDKETLKHKQIEDALKACLAQ